jgi:putative ABC transport system ATP-binding protein
MLTGSNITAEELKVRTHELLDSLGVEHKFDSYPKDLSVGEQQRASIARALVHKPSVVFADEPTSALDDKSTESVIRLLEEETEKVGASLIIVTHDSRLKTRYKDRVELQPLKTA